MATLVVLAGRMIPTEEILKVSSRYLDWFRFYEFFFVKNPTNCPIIGLVPYVTSAVCVCVEKMGVLVGRSGFHENLKFVCLPGFL